MADLAASADGLITLEITHRHVARLGARQPGRHRRRCGVSLPGPARFLVAGPKVPAQR
ncbi:hypothetical protein FRAAL6650 [Frankia alni ACN14a]|uniref:Uncharacterized protein n=1 Tax=Frankia alni (strain DSM 45986 / CECT 9034 / ACN14a) TaxID=326424 RepID=Q0RBB3_FRAAA|nr:hypothetical protein FRAAL6650 [Frankia alni ACN14a]